MIHFTHFRTFTKIHKSLQKGQMMWLFAVTQHKACNPWSLTGWPSLAYCIERWATIMRRQVITALNASFHVWGPLDCRGPDVCASRAS